MRVATRSLYQGIQQRISLLSSELKDLNEQVTTGKKIHRLSDDPIGLIDSLGLKSVLSQVEQYNRNMKTGESWLNASESAMSQAFQLLNRAKEISVQMGTGTQTAETRANAAYEVDHLLDQAIALGNTEVGGSYIFAGYRTRTAPFSRTTLGGIETAEYHGDTNDFRIRIGKDELLTVGENGQTVFMDSGIFVTLGTLKKALEDNDRDAITQQLDGLNKAQSDLNSLIAGVGARTNRLEWGREALSSLSLNIEERLSQVEDADFAEVATELKGKELTYQAALASAVKITELSLLNYLS